MNQLDRVLLWGCFIFCVQFSTIHAQAEVITDPKATEDWSFPPRKIESARHTMPTPTDAVILLGEGVMQWQKKDGSPADWTIEKGVMTVKPGSGEVISKASFEDCHLHVEWKSPSVIKGEGQGRGNSGIFLQSRYEVQVLDCNNNETYYNGQKLP